METIPIRCIAYDGESDWGKSTEGAIWRFKKMGSDAHVTRLELPPNGNGTFIDEVLFFGVERLTGRIGSEFNAAKTNFRINRIRLISIAQRINQNVTHVHLHEANCQAKRLESK